MTHRRRYAVSAGAAERRRPAGARPAQSALGAVPARRAARADRDAARRRRARASCRRPPRPRCSSHTELAIAEPDDLTTERARRARRRDRRARRPHRRRLFRVSAHALRHPARAPLRLRRRSVHGDRHLVRVAADHRSPACSGSSPRRCRSSPGPSGETDLHRLLRQPRHHDRLSRLPRRARRPAARRASASRTSSRRPTSRPTLDGLQREIAALWSLGADSPHHFLAASPRVPLEPAITAYARESVDAHALGAGRGAAISASRSTATSPTTTKATKVDTAAARRLRR